ncbi:MAG: HNH endonuclease [Candidatus Entotheonellia bacterium]
MDEQERRDAVRRMYEYRCGYCGVHEEEAGGLLEIDHFEPRSVGGRDDLDNLVYCCPTCNRLKGDFWGQVSPDTTPHRILHPRHDNLGEHLHEEDDGRLVALTQTGTFHITRLRLNRAPLIALRRARREQTQLRQDLKAVQEEQRRLRQSITVLERELHEILILLSRLLDEEN